MDYFPVIFSLLFVAFQGAPETAVLGAELSTRAENGGENPPPSTPWRHRRSKRCSCSSLMDKECVYFCHLDIIWACCSIRPGKPFRSKRSLKDLLSMKATDNGNRCQCADQKDKKCWNFCQAGKDLRAQNTMQKGLEDFKKRRACSKLGKKCIYQQLVEGRKIRRLEAISNSIRTSFRVAKLKAELYRDQKLIHNRAH